MILHIPRFDREEVVPEATRALSSVKGDVATRVDLRSATATVRYDAARTSTAKLIASLQQIGYRSIEDGPDRWPPKPEKLTSS